ncbi:hypothetical protein RB195_002407 [Necator americanus]|uniref:UBA domain-containing protein n=1 Tax=Necator americanus TaxID=51031 RepID=A0ABR1DIX2_NECAM
MQTGSDDKQWGTEGWLTTSLCMKYIWRILSTASDQCSVNAQISLRSYSTPEQYDIYFIQNMDNSSPDTNCTVVSLENPQGVKAEKRLLRKRETSTDVLVDMGFQRENSNCQLLEIARNRMHKESERIQYLSLDELTSEADGIRRNGDAIVRVLNSSVGKVIDLLIIGSEKNSHDNAKFVLKKFNENSEVAVCQRTLEKK